MIRLPPQNERRWNRITVEDIEREQRDRDAQVERELEKVFATLLQRISFKRLREFRHTNPLDSQTDL